jgi:hypothetical protein
VASLELRWLARLVLLAQQDHLLVLKASQELEALGRPDTLGYQVLLEFLAIKALLVYRGKQAPRVVPVLPV